VVRRRRPCPLFPTPEDGRIDLVLPPDFPPTCAKKKARPQGHRGDRRDALQRGPSGRGPCRGSCGSSATAPPARLTGRADDGDGAPPSSRTQALARRRAHRGVEASPNFRARALHRSKSVHMTPLRSPTRAPSRLGHRTSAPSPGSPATTSSTRPPSTRPAPADVPSRPGPSSGARGVLAAVRHATTRPRGGFFAVRIGRWGPHLEEVFRPAAEGTPSSVTKLRLEPSPRPACYSTAAPYSLDRKGLAGGALPECARNVGIGPRLGTSDLSPTADGGPRRDRGNFSPDDRVGSSPPGSQASRSRPLLPALGRPRPSPVQLKGGDTGRFFPSATPESRANEPRVNGRIRRLYHIGPATGSRPREGARARLRPRLRRGGSS